MNVPLIVFFALAAIAVLGAISLILQRHPIHSALSLIVVMVALAGLYLLMGAEFVAAAQIIVYGGAIMVLFVFVIMLLNAGVEERTSFSSLAKFAGLPLAVALMGCLFAAIYGAPEQVQIAAQAGAPAPTKALSAQLFQESVYPFELTSFLILVAIVGAMVLAQRDSKESHL
jgi:NADH-quinone oxidoreductase subunit J